MKNWTDSELFDALCRGDSEALDFIYRKFEPEVRQWICRNSGTAEEAADIFQEALLTIYDSYCGQKRKMSSFGGLLFNICRNKWLSQLRRNKRHEVVRMEVPERYQDADDDLLAKAIAAEEDFLRQEALDKTFAMLSELCRNLLELVAQGLKPDEIVEWLGMTNANAVYQRKKACIDRWRTLFHQHYAQNAKS
ncbi:MAG: RNA polymerase sigma factor [Bacteroidetes bacterium]|nr:MAG: RNA polymerase sigma factor [Bacteroidota bacterium]